MNDPTPAELRAAVNEIVAALLRVPREHRLAELKRRIAALPSAEFRDAAETLILQTESLMNGGSSRWEKIAVLIFATVFLVTLLVIAIAVKQPTPFQLFVFRVVLALAAGGAAWFIPGFIDVRINLPKVAIRATGAIAVFLIVYLVNPPSLVVTH